MSSATVNEIQMRNKKPKIAKERIDLAEDAIAFASRPIFYSFCALSNGKSGREKN